MAELGWVVLTKDKRIRRRINERRAFERANAVGFWLSANDLGQALEAEAFRRALPQMKRIVRSHSRPCMGLVDRSGRVSVILGERLGGQPRD